MCAFVAAVAALRLVPHPYNFAPVTAMALFGGAHFDRRAWAFAVPLAAMALSDLALEGLFGIGFHDQMAAVYLSFAAVVGIGLLLRGRRRTMPIAAASVAASVLFFVVTNFGVWATGTLYPLTLSGLIACYVAAIPFFGSTLLGDLFYVGVLFGGFALAERAAPRLAPTPSA